ncbi:MAG TPA: FAD-binding protein [Bryobacteraceae bacterium]|nr:FAD-binding protein [Bryobacteraceae bacterium]
MAVESAVRAAAPATVEDFAQALRDAGAAGRSIELRGAGSKQRMAGPVAAAEVAISTASLRRVLQYEPDDLTISVQAGMPWRELAALLATHRQMIALDAPFFDTATVGGIVAANTSGPRRRLYGTARDLIIGMKFVTLEGKTVSSGGMVVKNVAGLDMAKLMIGSFGTLAAIAVVNFKVLPIPEATRTFVQRFESADEAFAARDLLLRSVLQPAALDMLNPAASVRVGLDGWALVLEAAGTAAVLECYSAELPRAERIEGEPQRALWEAIREFTPRWLAENPDGVVVRRSVTLTGVADAMRSAMGPAVARAGNGIAYLYGERAASGRGAVVEFAPQPFREREVLWPEPGSDFELMTQVKRLFDPGMLLNKGRLYGRI